MLQDPNLRHPIAISLGTVVAALNQYYITLWFANRFGTAFPYGTFCINITGCLAMGFFTTLVFERGPAVPPEVQLMIITSFLGVYTTF